MKKNTEERSLLTNIIISIFCLLSLFIVPQILALFFYSFIKSIVICELLTYIVYLLLLISIYYKDLKADALNFFKNFLPCIKDNFKWYILGVVIMVCFNLILTSLLDGIANNEELVRQNLLANPLMGLFSVMIFAPLSEEIIFRKGITSCCKNKYIGIPISALLFGCCHVITTLTTYTDLLFILPYASLGFSFAVMNYNSKNIFTSIFYHSLHNTISFVLIMLLYNFGAM